MQIIFVVELMEYKGGHHTCFINSLLVALTTLVPLVRFLLCCFGFSFDHFSHEGSYHNRSENQWEYSVYAPKLCTWTLEKYPCGRSIDLLNPLWLRSGLYVWPGSISHHTRQKIQLSMSSQTIYLTTLKRSGYFLISRVWLLWLKVLSEGELGTYTTLLVCDGITEPSSEGTS